MFGFIKDLFGDSLEKRHAKAVAQDKAVRENMTNKDYDKNVKDTMAGSDPIAKY